MSKSDLLRVQDVRDAYRLIGDCRDLGSDPVLWQVRMFEGLCGLIGAPAATGGEGLVRPDGAIAPLSSLHSGFDTHAAGLLDGYMRDHGPAVDPFIQALQAMQERRVTRTRRQTVPDAAYYRSMVFQKHLRMAGVHHRLVSMYRTGEGAISVIHFHRSAGERDFTARQVAMLGFFHEEIGRLIGRALVSAAEPGPENLSRRLRQTLACLVEGDTEKQVAARLGISQATAHQYVTSLYRRFGVRSRGQLLAHVIRRRGRLAWSLESTT
jgi:DNA-binding CsgD family transcriptional regulator